MIRDYRSFSLWLDAEPPVVGPPLIGDTEADVVIIGAGFTGLWLAYYLRMHAPGLSVAVLEKEAAGYGASGRNGGWLIGGVAGQEKWLASMSGGERVLTRQLLYGIVDEVKRVTEAEGIDCDLAHGGVLYAAARYPEQEALARRLLKELHRCGHTEDDFAWWSADELARHLRLPNGYGAIFSPHCGVLQPAALAKGLARVVRAKGARVYEQSHVIAFEPGRVTTTQGQIKARFVLPVVEGFAPGLSPMSKYLLPVYSLIVATEPLTAAQWDEIGLSSRPAYADFCRLVTYGQRSADGRLVFGARGGYDFGGRSREHFSPDSKMFSPRKALFDQFFPSLRDVKLTHGWGGSLALSRRFSPHAIIDRETGIGTAGGYGGEGVGAANLMARTLVDMLLARPTELVEQPWAINGKLSQLKRWEPEPLRWLANAGVGLAFAWEDKLCSNRNTPKWQRKAVCKMADLMDSLLH